jgi:hypothetical protein
VIWMNPSPPVVRAVGASSIFGLSAIFTHRLLWSAV